jgi:hypothetical protein
MERRLEDRIRELCRLLVETKDSSEKFPGLADELRDSLALHIERVRARLVQYPTPVERRLGR